MLRRLLQAVFLAFVSSFLFTMLVVAAHFTLLMWYLHHMQPHGIGAVAGGISEFVPLFLLTFLVLIVVFYRYGSPKRTPPQA